MKIEKLKEFLEKYPDMSLLGFAWALYWRLGLVIVGISVVLSIIIGIFE